MKTESVLTYGTITLSIQEVGTLIQAIQYTIDHSINDPDFKSMQNELKALFKRMSGKEYGVR